MTDQLISKEDAAQLGFAIHEMIDDLERRGFERGHIGSAMAGIGMALVQIHQGHDSAIAVLNSARDCLVRDVSSVS